MPASGLAPLALLTFWALHTFSAFEHANVLAFAQRYPGALFAYTAIGVMSAQHGLNGKGEIPGIPLRTKALSVFRFSGCRQLRTTFLREEGTARVAGVKHWCAGRFIDALERFKVVADTWVVRHITALRDAQRQHKHKAN